MVDKKKKTKKKLGKGFFMSWLEPKLDLDKKKGSFSTGRRKFLLLLLLLPEMHAKRVGEWAVGLLTFADCIGETEIAVLGNLLSSCHIDRDGRANIAHNGTQTSHALLLYLADCRAAGGAGCLGRVG